MPPGMWIYDSFCNLTAKVDGIFNVLLVAQPVERLPGVNVGCGEKSANFRL